MVNLHLVYSVIVLVQSSLSNWNLCSLTLSCALLEIIKITYNMDSYKTSATKLHKAITLQMPLNYWNVNVFSEISCQCTCTCLTHSVTMQNTRQNVAVSLWFLTGADVHLQSILAKVKILHVWNMWLILVTFTWWWLWVSYCLLWLGPRMHYHNTSNTTIIIMKVRFTQVQWAQCTSHVNLTPHNLQVAESICKVD